MTRFITVTSADGKTVRTWNLDKVSELALFHREGGDSYFIDSTPLEECEYKQIMSAIEALTLRGR